MYGGERVRFIALPLPPPRHIPKTSRVPVTPVFKTDPPLQQASSSFFLQTVACENAAQSNGHYCFSPVGILHHTWLITISPFPSALWHNGLLRSLAFFIELELTKRSSLKLILNPLGRNLSSSTPKSLALLVQKVSYYNYTIRETVRTAFSALSLQRNKTGQLFQ